MIMMMIMTIMMKVMVIMMMKKSMRMDFLGQKCNDQDLHPHGHHEDDHGHAAAHGQCHHRGYIDDDDDKGGVPIKEERNDVSNYLLTDRDPLLSKDDILGQLL